MLFSRTTERRAATLNTVEEMLADRRILSSSGVYVTAETSIQRVAVFASANLLAQTISQLPIDLLRGDGAKKTELPKPSLLLDPSGEGYGFSDWAWSVLFRALVQGNAVGYVAQQDAMGFPTVIQLQDIANVSARYDDKGARVWKINGEVVPTDRIFHLRGFPLEGQVLGLSPIGNFMRTIGIGIQAEQFGADFFRDGAHPTAILSTDARLTDTQAKSVKARILDAIRGSREPLLLPSDIKYQQIQINPLESQFLETQKYSAAECARIFGPGVPEMLGYETGGSMTYANVEQRSLHLLIYSLNAWACRLESALSTPRMTPRGQYVRLNRNALLQSTTLDRFKAHEIALKNGFEYINEVRELEDRGPVAWGNEPFALTAAPSDSEDDKEGADS